MANAERVGRLIGTFDMFHVGHVDVIRSARERCDRLVAHVVDDDLYEQWTGQRPWIGFADRLELMSAVRGIEEVVEFRPDEPFGADDVVMVTHECPRTAVSALLPTETLLPESSTASTLLAGALDPPSSSVA